MRTVCHACGTLVCRKCAGAESCKPDPNPCFACGAQGVAAFYRTECAVDMGVLLVVTAKEAPPAHA